jgi:hypothetical protein
MTGLDGCGRTDSLATAKTGLKVHHELDTRVHAKAIEDSDAEMASLNTKGSEWIYPGVSR